MRHIFVLVIVVSFIVPLQAKALSCKYFERSYIVSCDNNECSSGFVITDKRSIFTCGIKPVITELPSWAATLVFNFKNDFLKRNDDRSNAVYKLTIRSNDPFGKESIDDLLKIFATEYSLDIVDLKMMATESVSLKTEILEKVQNIDKETILKKAVFKKLENTTIERELDEWKKIEIEEAKLDDQIIFMVYSTNVFFSLLLLLLAFYFRNFVTGKKFGIAVTILFLQIIVFVLLEKLFPSMDWSSPLDVNLILPKIIFLFICLFQAVLLLRTMVSWSKHKNKQNTHTMSQ